MSTSPVYKILIRFLRATCCFLLVPSSTSAPRTYLCHYCGTNVYYQFQFLKNRLSRSFLSCVPAHFCGIRVRTSASKPFILVSLPSSAAHTFTMAFRPSISRPCSYLWHTHSHFGPQAFGAASLPLHPRHTPPFLASRPSFSRARLFYASRP